MIEEQECVLVVDDARDTLEILDRDLSAHGYRVFTAPGVDEALRILESTPVDLVITDFMMPKRNGLDLVRHIRENLANTEVMMITGYGSIGGAVNAVRSGAEDYLTKPFTEEELIAAVERTLDKVRLRRDSQARAGTKTAAPHGLIAQSRAMRDIFAVMQRVAPNSATVLISGESGTGKELVARAIHYASPRAAAPFLPINCGAIPQELFESELFGHVRGAFTGAIESRAGFFQTADGGTIFLDEISEMKLGLQVKLLRVLEDREVYMVGATRPVKVDIRIIATTNKDLMSLVKKGAFREDLYFRLLIITIAIPPLRRREEDILLLAHHFAVTSANEFGKPIPRFTHKALEALKNYDWPGNVRELKNVVQRLVLMSDTGIIDVTDLPPNMRFSISFHTGLNRTLAEVESEHIRSVTASVGGNKTKAAEILGIDRKTLREKLKDRHEDPEKS
jgi:DNA-binding NtrC family response regulator